MILPIALIAQLQPAKVFTSDALVVRNGEIMPYEDDMAVNYKGTMIPSIGVQQIFFLVKEIIQGASVMYGTGKRRKLVRIIWIDAQRNWTTIEYPGGLKHQRTVSLGGCYMADPHLVPIHFDHYKEIMEELKELRDKKDYSDLDYVVSNSYDVMVKGDQQFAIRKADKLQEEINRATVEVIKKSGYPELINNEEAQHTRKDYNDVIVKINKLLGIKDYYELQPNYTYELKEIE